MIINIDHSLGFRHDGIIRKIHSHTLYRQAGYLNKKEAWKGVFDLALQLQFQYPPAPIPKLFCCSLVQTPQMVGAN